MLFKYHNEECDLSVLISDNCIKSMITVLKKHYPNEFGGILLGVRGNHLTIVDFKEPVNYEITRTKFVRKHDELNQYLADAYQKSNGLLEYLGEWHSHPNGSANFSDDDKKTMLRIADNVDVGFNSPILIIFSLTKNSYYFKIYVTFKNQLIEFKKVDSNE